MVLVTPKRLTTFASTTVSERPPMPPMNDPYEDPMQGRTVGHEPADDLTLGREVGEDILNDPTHGAGVGHAPDENRTQGCEIGEASYDDPTQGREVGSDRDEDPIEAPLVTSV